MLLNRFSVFLVFITLLGSVISCNVEEEDVDEVFKWEHVTGSGTAETVENYTSPNYKVTTTLTNMRIVGYPNDTDSLVINLGNLEGNELTVGEYGFGINNFFNLSFFKNGAVYNATAGSINVNYINSRIDFDFDVELSNGSRLTNGLADNLLLTNEGEPDGEKPVQEVIGTIEATINGAKFTWDKPECSATFASAPSYLAITGISVSNSISMAFTEIDSPAKLETLVGQTVQLGNSSNIINYTTTGGIAANYVTESGQAQFVSYSNNILTVNFSGVFVNGIDATDKIPFENGVVKAILIN